MMLYMLTVQFVFISRYGTFQVFATSSVEHAQSGDVQYKRKLNSRRTPGPLQCRICDIRITGKAVRATSVCLNLRSVHFTVLANFLTWKQVQKLRVLLL